MRLVLDRNELVGEALVHQVVAQADVKVTALIEHIQRPVPLVGREEVEQEELRLAKIILALRNLDDDRIRNLLCEFLAHDSALQAVLLVDRNDHLSGNPVVQLAAILIDQFRVRMLEHGYAVRQQQGLITLVLYRHPFVGAVKVLFLPD